MGGEGCYSEELSGTPTFRMGEPELGSSCACLTCSAAVESRVLLVLTKCFLLAPAPRLTHL